MTTQYQRIPIAENISLSVILDPKQKTNSLRIQFLQPLSEETASACALAGNLIVSSSGAYPSNAAMNRALHLLYGADLSCSVSRQGDLQLIALCASAIADRYALDKEPIFDSLLGIVLGCLFQPNTPGGTFDPTEFSSRKPTCWTALTRKSTKNAPMPFINCSRLPLPRNRQQSPAMAAGNMLQR